MLVASAVRQLDSFVLALGAELLALALFAAFQYAFQPLHAFSVGFVNFLDPNCRKDIAHYDDALVFLDLVAFPYESIYRC